MTKTEELRGIRGVIEDQLQSLRSHLDKLEGYLIVLSDIERMWAEPPSSGGRGYVTEEPTPAEPKQKEKLAKPEGMKRCQACNQLRRESEYAMGAQRPKRRCIHCDDGGSVERTQSKAPKETPRPAKRTAPRTSPPDSGGDLGGQRDPDAAMVYSKPVKCPKCQHPIARMERRADATVSDNWTCLEGGCFLRIGNYSIPIDRNYAGGATA